MDGWRPLFHYDVTEQKCHRRVRRWCRIFCVWLLTGWVRVYSICSSLQRWLIALVAVYVCGSRDEWVVCGWWSRLKIRWSLHCGYSSLLTTSDSALCCTQTLTAQGSPSSQYWALAWIEVLFSWVNHKHRGQNLYRFLFWGEDIWLEASLRLLFSKLWF